MKLYNFVVLITQDEAGFYIAKVPDLPGCHTQAKTLPALYERVREAIELCLEVEQDRKHKVSQDKFIGVQQVEVKA